ncbi:recombinase family protein [Shewanella sp. NFH-SH190041]|uniref:recombinase family protein n=1 Tax=Shewanella sp. NFH-SH190041 TaxID=2950245 RepID=UPI0021C3F2AF|nr:recombinase family protein [Shewanella sp. NFH-SH190041]
MRTFAYIRMTQFESDFDSKKADVLSKVQDLQPQRIFSDCVDIKVPAMNRPEFKNLIENRMEEGDKLVVAGLDGLGNGAANILQTLHNLTQKGILLQSLDIPFDDINSANLDNVFPVIHAIAEFDKKRLLESSITNSADLAPQAPVMPVTPPPAVAPTPAPAPQAVVEAAPLAPEPEPAPVVESNAPKVKIISPLFGEFQHIYTTTGDPVIELNSKITAGQIIATIDVKGLKNDVIATHSGIVKEIKVKSGEHVTIDQELLILE